MFHTLTEIIFKPDPVICISQNVLSTYSNYLQATFNYSYNQKCLIHKLFSNYIHPAIHMFRISSTNRNWFQATFSHPHYLECFLLFWLLFSIHIQPFTGFRKFFWLTEIIFKSYSDTYILQNTSLTNRNYFSAMFCYTHAPQCNIH